MDMTLEVDLIPLGDTNEKIVAFILSLDGPLEIPFGAEHYCTVKHPKGESPDTLSAWFSTDGEEDQWYDTKLTFFHTSSPLSIKGLDASRLVLDMWFPQDEITMPWGNILSKLQGVSEHRTVVVAQCLVSADSLDENWEVAVTSLLRRSIGHINVFQNAYHAATHRTTKVVTHLLTEEKLQPVVPYVTIETLGEDNRHGVSLCSFENTASIRRIVREPQYEEENYLDTKKYLNGASSLAFSTFMNVQREAMVARKEGNNVVASILIGLSAELLISNVVRLLWWDSGVSPSEAAVNLGRYNSISKLVNNVLQQKLGGSSSEWDQNRGDSPFGLWRQHVANLRNKSAHTGYTPSNDEIDDALQSFSVVSEFLYERMIANIENFPRSVMMQMGTNEIEARHATKRFNRSLPEMDSSPIEDFTRWLKEVEGALSQDTCL